MKAKGNIFKNNEFRAPESIMSASKDLQSSTCSYSMKISPPNAFLPTSACQGASLGLNVRAVPRFRPKPSRSNHFLASLTPCPEASPKPWRGASLAVNFSRVLHFRPIRDFGRQIENLGVDFGDQTGNLGVDFRSQNGSRRRGVFITNNV